MTSSVQIELSGRWDALALSRRLIPYRSFLVQYGHEQWRVYAEAPGYHGERLPSALHEIEQCLNDRRIGSATVRVDGRPYEKQ